MARGQVLFPHSVAWLSRAEFNPFRITRLSGAYQEQHNTKANKPAAGNKVQGPLAFAFRWRAGVMISTRQPKQ
jgi:hypothetical protein